MTALTTAQLDEIEKRYGDKTPTRPCPVCGGMNWGIEAAGMGRLTWACQAAKPPHHGGTGDKMDWAHYSTSSHEVTCGDENVISLVAIARAALAWKMSHHNGNHQTQDAAMQALWDALPDLLPSEDR